MVTYKNDLDFLERRDRDKYISAIREFVKNPSYEIAKCMDDGAEYLNRHYGYSWEELEQLEIEVYTEE